LGGDSKRGARGDTEDLMREGLKKNDQAKKMERKGRPWKEEEGRKWGGGPGTQTKGGKGLIREEEIPPCFVITRMRRSQTPKGNKEDETQEVGLS